MNGLYIRRLGAGEVALRILPFLSGAGLIGSPPSDDQRAYVERLVPLVHERLEELSEAPELLEFFFNDVALADPALLVPKKMDPAGTAQALAAARRWRRLRSGAKASSKKPCARWSRSLV